MASPIVPFSLTAPGFWGLNTQDSSVDLNPNFALEANNCIIDRFGRVGSRKGWEPINATSADLGTSSVASLGELVSSTGVITVIAAGNNKIFKVGATLTNLTYGGGGVAPTITANDWQMVQLNGAMVMFQIGHDPLIYEPSLSTTQYRRLSEHPLYTGSAPLANTALSAYGRVWAASTSTDKNTVYWTDTLTYVKWTGGTSGSLNLYGVWPNGGDEIVAIAAHNNNLIIFGKRQTLIYEGADDPSTMKLSDVIGGSGCIARDTVKNTPFDVIYLSASGLRSIKRTIQEKSSPMSLISRNVNDDLIAYIQAETDSSKIKGVYSPIDNFYLITFITFKATYCFDMKSTLEDGSNKVTAWTKINPQCFTYISDYRLVMGFSGYVGNYSGYLDSGAAYRMTYYTPWLDFGDPIRESILKKITMSLFGAVSDTLIYKWRFNYKDGSYGQPVVGNTGIPAEYNIAEYNVAEYAGYSNIQDLSVNATGRGKVIQIGIESLIEDYPLSIQRIDVVTKNGAYMV